MYGAVPIDARLTLQGIDHCFHTYAGEGHTVWGGSTSFPNQYWDPIFFQTRDFLYTYSVPANVDSYFCWNVVNGTVISTNNEQITVQWNTVGTGQLEVTEANCLDVIGTAQMIDVEVSECNSCANVNLAIQFDGFPTQSSWDIVDSGGNIVASGSGYTSGSSTIIESTCLLDGCYTLNFYDAA